MLTHNGMIKWRFSRIGPAYQTGSGQAICTIENRQKFKLMKTTLFLFFLMFFCIYNAICQREAHEFGKLSQKEFDMKVYEKDPKAEAVILFDIGQSEFIDTQNGFIIQFTRKKRIKIFSQAGFDFAEFSIPFYQDGGKFEKVMSIEGFSYNYENNVLNKKALDKAAIYEETINENWKVKKCVLPDVREGTIIEYKYVVETPFHFNLPDWVFQDKIPTMYSEYTVMMIPFYEYVFLMQGTKSFTYQHSEQEVGIERIFGGLAFNDMVHIYAMKDVPAMKDESYMTSMQDYIMKMDFQLAKFTNLNGTSTSVMSTWEELNKSMMKHTDFGKCIKKDQKTAEGILASELKIHDLNQVERARTVIDYVKNTFRWNGRNAKYASKSVKELVAEKVGNSADINLFLIALLQAAGLEAEPVLISTRSHGKIKTDYPFSHFFNYVIVLVKTDNGLFVTDGTESNISFNRIPPRCMNEKGLVVSENAVKWVDLSTETVSLNETNIEMDIHPELLTSNTKVLIKATEYESLGLKEKFANDSTKFSKHLIDNGCMNVSGIRFVNAEIPQRPYVIGFSGDHKMEHIDGKLLIYPFLSFPLKENRLTQPTRSYPVDFIYPKSVLLRSKITIPEDYSVVDQPEKIEIKNGLANISLKCVQKDNVLTVEGEYTFHKSIYQPGEYAAIKLYMDNIVKFFNTPLVIEQVRTSIK
jgi:hypothetical protein